MAEKYFYPEWNENVEVLNIHDVKFFNYFNFYIQMFDHFDTIKDILITQNYNAEKQYNDRSNSDFNITNSVTFNRMKSSER